MLETGSDYDKYHVGVSETRVLPLSAFWRRGRGSFDDFRMTNDWGCVQRGGEGNVHRDAGVQTHKGLADKLKDRMFKKGEK